MLKALMHFDVTYIPDGLCPPGAESTIFISEKVVLGSSVYIGPNTQIIGRVVIGRGVRIVGNSVLDGTDGPIFVATGTKIEPFAFVKGPAEIGKDCVIRARCSFRNSSCGDDCDLKGEIENCILGNRIITHASCIMYQLSCGNDCNLGAHINRTEMGHRVKAKYGNSNLLDAKIGNDVNIGAGTITANFDGTPEKKKTEVGEGSFLGVGTSIVATYPVRKIGRNVTTAAGITIRRDVPDNAFVGPDGIFRPNQLVNDGKGHWHRKKN